VTQTNEELINIARGGDPKAAAKARAQLVEQNLGMVFNEVRRYSYWHVPEEDLVQEGAFGLLLAVERFEDRGTRFTTYAMYWVRNAIDIAIREGVARTDRQKRVFYRTNRAIGQMRSEGIFDPSDAQIAERVGAREEDVLAVRTRTAMRMSCDSPRAGSDHGRSFDELYASDAPSPEAELIEVTERRRRMFALNDALGKLNKRERSIVLRHHLSEKHETLQDIGDDLGLSRERVRQVEKVALAKIREHVTRDLEAA
jgi:RNA polymerase sigma factor (sigma-70 family)